jgi:hypothetical protein
MSNNCREKTREIWLWQLHFTFTTQMMKKHMHKNSTDNRKAIDVSHKQHRQSTDKRKEKQ